MSQPAISSCLVKDRAAGGDSDVFSPLCFCANLTFPRFVLKPWSTGATSLQWVSAQAGHEYTSAALTSQIPFLPSSQAAFLMKKTEVIRQNFLYWLLPTCQQIQVAATCKVLGYREDKTGLGTASGSHGPPLLGQLRLQVPSQVVLVAASHSSSPSPLPQLIEATSESRLDHPGPNTGFIASSVSWHDTKLCFCSSALTPSLHCLHPQGLLDAVSSTF